MNIAGSGWHVNYQVIKFTQICFWYKLPDITAWNRPAPDNSRLKEGLGLKSIDSRVSYLNGVIQYDSVPGKGTTINLEIPLHD